ncbi:MAG: translocation/assembly module TamB domain-containing protein, partial [Prevotella sp.]|nr:translocation/assembly module TamB domain-containing protein [Prevotella sp.]
IGRSFSTNNIRVNCVMNIEGTPNQPTVDFDLEMPTVNSDAEQMVRSVINSEEELNQQVIYLLTIGRFYNQDTDTENETGQSQTSLAMQSLLSGTISQQINSVLSNVIKSNNWNFGANISTGNEGWNNAEYEGLLSGRLLNNRLLFNGQFGYRDNPNATTSFIGDFDIQYLLFPNGNLAVKVYNQTNDRYFIKNSLNTQGIGLIMKKDFNGWRELLGLDNRKRKKEKTKKQ